MASERFQFDLNQMFWATAAFAVAAMFLANGNPLFVCFAGVGIGVLLDDFWKGVVASLFILGAWIAFAWIYVLIFGGL